MKDNFLIQKFGERTICICGVGKMFFQDGFPISLAVAELAKKEIEVSLFHVADECLKNGWSAKTTLAKLTEDFKDDISGASYDLAALEQFCHASYEDQREMIFQYLFGCTTNDARAGNVSSSLITFLAKPEQ